MKITNKTGLPEPIIQALQQDNYSRGERTDYSVTQLLKPPQMVALSERYADKIEYEASDMLWSLLGKSVHYIIERQSGGISEERFYASYMGKTVSGQIDHYNHGALIDYKVTSVWSRIYGSRGEEWEQQLNAYASLLRKNDYQVSGLAIIVMYRDWSETKAKADPAQYPKSPIEIIDVNLWDEKFADKFIEQRVALHESQQDTDPSGYTPCTDEERWAKDDVWAVMKDGRKSAVKLHDTEASAVEHVNNLGPKHYVVLRKGESTRCAKYCSVSQFCKQYEKIKEAENAS